MNCLITNVLEHTGNMLKSSNIIVFADGFDLTNCLGQPYILFLNLGGIFSSRSRQVANLARTKLEPPFITANILLMPTNGCV